MHYGKPVQYSLYPGMMCAKPLQMKLYVLLALLLDGFQRCFGEFRTFLQR